MDYEGHNKCSDEGRDGLNRESQFFGDSTVDSITICSDLTRSGRAWGVEEGNLLSESLSNEVYPELFDGADCGDRNEDGPYIYKEEFCDKEIDKVEAEWIVSVCSKDP